MREIEIKHLNRADFNKLVAKAESNPDNHPFLYKIPDRTKNAMCYYSYVDKNNTLIKLYCDEP